MLPSSREQCGGVDSISEVSLHLLTGTGEELNQEQKFRKQLLEEGKRQRASPSSKVEREPWTEKSLGASIFTWLLFHQILALLYLVVETSVSV